MAAAPKKAEKMSGAADEPAKEELYPIAVWIDELKHDDIQLRLNSMRHLSTIATALGPARTREELLPFLNESIDDDDEILLVLAEQLGDFVEYVGGPDFATELLGPLESLATVEELAVRDKALEALSTVCAAMTAEQHTEHVEPLVRRLATRDWFTSRVSACGLFPVAYGKGTPATRTAFRGLFGQLCRDDTPMVRRAAAKAMHSLLPAVEAEALLPELLPPLLSLCEDSEDSVRVLAPAALVVMARLLPDDASDDDSQPGGGGGGDPRLSKLAPAFLELTTDESWRVRWAAAEQLCHIVPAVASPAAVAEYEQRKAAAAAAAGGAGGEEGGEELAPPCPGPLPSAEIATSLVRAFVDLLQDSEAEVRIIAAFKLPAVTQAVGADRLLSDMLPAVQALSADPHPQARAALARVVMDLSPLLGKEATVEHLLTLFLNLLRDEDSEVRLSVISHLQRANDVIGVRLLSERLLPAIVELAADRQWRVRLAMLEYLPLLGKQLGVDFFNEKLATLYMAWLGDSVCSIREAATDSLTALTQVFGQEWTAQSLLPSILEQFTHAHYLHRLSALLSVGVLSQCMPAQTVADSLLPAALSLVSDAVPNIRFNVAIILRKIAAVLPPQTVTAMVIPALRTLSSDSDVDVKYYAERAVLHLQQQSK